MSKCLEGKITMDYFVILDTPLYAYLSVSWYSYHKSKSSSHCTGSWWPGEAVCIQSGLWAGCWLLYPSGTWPYPACPSHRPCGGGWCRRSPHSSHPSARGRWRERVSQTMCKVSVCGEEILTLSRISCRERKSLFSTHPQAKEGSSSPIITLTSWEIDGGWTSVMLLVKGQNNFMNHRNCYLVTHFLALVLQPLQLQHLAYPVQKPSVSGNSAQNYDGFGDNIRSVLCAVHLCKDEFMGW